MMPIVRTTVVRVRYADTDKMGIVYNGNYFQYFEIGRTELLRAIGLPYSDLERQGYLMPVLEAHAEFKKPARYDELLEIECTFHPANSPRIHISYVIRRANDICVIGHTKHTFVDANTFKPIRLPADFVKSVNEASNVAAINVTDNS